MLAATSAHSTLNARGDCGWPDYSTRDKGGRPAVLFCLATQEVNARRPVPADWASLVGG